MQHKPMQMTLAKFMEFHGLTDMDVGHALRVDKSTVWRWRTGRALPPKRQRVKIDHWTGGVVGQDHWPQREAEEQAA